MAKNTTDERIQRIGKKVRKLRLEAGFTSYPDFAYGADIGRRPYWELETGQHPFNITTLLKVLDVHELSLEEFFKGL